MTIPHTGRARMNESFNADAQLLQAYPHAAKEIEAAVGNLQARNQHLCDPVGADQIRQLIALEYAVAMNELTGFAVVVVYESDRRIAMVGVVEDLAYQQRAAIPRAVNQHGLSVRVKAIAPLDQFAKEAER